MSKLFKTTLALAIAMAFSMSTVSAADITTAGGTGVIDVTANIEAATFDVTVTNTLSVSLLAGGSHVCATNAKIVNNSLAPVQVIDVSCIANTSNGFKLGSYDDNYKTKKINDLTFGLILNGNKFDPLTGKINLIPADWVIASGGELPLTYDISMGAQENASNPTLGQIPMVIDWAR